MMMKPTKKPTKKLNHLANELPHNFDRDEITSSLDEKSVIWSEGSIEGVLEKFVHILKVKFRANHAYVFRVFDKSSIVKISQWKDRSSSCAEVPAGSECDAETKRQIELSIRESCSSRDLDFGATSVEKPQYPISDIMISGEEFHLVNFGHVLNCQMIAVWKKPSHSLNVKASVDLALIVSRELSWYGKIEDLQAKLGRDDLTQLKNYTSMNQIIDSEIKRANRFQQQFSLLFIDVDDLKSINDHYGHAAGTLVLKAISQKMSEMLREIDHLFRYGGDEFVIMLLGAGNNESRNAADRIRKGIASLKFQNISDKLTATVSIGVSIYPNDATTKEELLKISDHAMYVCKKSGKNSVTSAQDVSTNEFSTE
jgi:diguanylate cyclase (GGDEF)-like protein